MLESLWRDDAAARYAGADELVYRANLLGQDLTITNWKGGNISAKVRETDFDGRPVRVLRIKGSGSDLRTAVRADFVGVRHEPVLELERRTAMSDEDMVAYLARCLTDLPSKRPSIETLMHSFLPFEHIDHVHADHALMFAAMEGGRKAVEEQFQGELVWVEYHRPGFTLAKTVCEAVRANPKAKGVILAQHGLLTWGATSKECYHATLSMLTRLGAAAAKPRTPFGGARTETLPAASRRDVLFKVLPALRGALGARRPVVLHVDDSEAVLEFVNGAASRELAATGAACPDHLVSTKRVPVFARWDPKGGTADALAQELVAAVEDFRKDYEAWFARWNRDASMAMDDPFPRVLLIPGVGMVCSGKTKEAAKVTSSIYLRAIAVMRGIHGRGAFTSLGEEDSFHVEYWPLERFKLTTLPPDRPMTGKVVLISKGLGPSCGARLAAEGAHVVPLDTASEASVLEGFRAAVLEFGGIDVVVIQGGSAPVRDLSLEAWNARMDALATGPFLASREAFRVFRRQGRGGSLVFVGSGRSTDGAAQLHLARCLAEEGAASGIRVNTVLGEDVEALLWFAGPGSLKSTGNILNMEGGGPAAYPR